MRHQGVFEDRFRKFFVLFLLIVVAGAFLGMIRGFLIALLLAAMFSALIYSWQSTFTRLFGGRQRLAAALVIVLFILAVGIPLLLMTGMVAAEALQISSRVTPWIREQLQEGAALGGLPEWLPFRDELAPYRRTLLERAGEGVAAMGQFLVAAIPEFTQGTVAMLIDVFVLLYAMYFFLVYGPSWLSSAKHYVPLRADDRDEIVDRGYIVMRAALKGILVIGVLQGVLVGLAFWVAGLGGAFFWGAITLILSAIPGLGPPLVWIPAAIYLFATGDTGWGIAMIAWGAGPVGLVDNVLRPRVVGRDAKLPDLLIFVSTLGGIVMFGAAGILIGPILAAMLVIMLRIYHRAFATALPED